MFDKLTCEIHETLEGNNIAFKWTIYQLNQNQLELSSWTNNMSNSWLLSKRKLLCPRRRLLEKVFTEENCSKKMKIYEEEVWSKRSEIRQGVHLCDSGLWGWSAAGCSQGGSHRIKLFVKFFTINPRSTSLDLHEKCSTLIALVEIFSGMNGYGLFPREM